MKTPQPLPSEAYCQLWNLLLHRFWRFITPSKKLRRSLKRDDFKRKVVMNCIWFGSVCLWLWVFCWQIKALCANISSLVLFQPSFYQGRLLVFCWVAIYIYIQNCIFWVNDHMPTFLELPKTKTYIYSWSISFSSHSWWVDQRNINTSRSAKQNC